MSQLLLFYFYFKWYDNGELEFLKYYKSSIILLPFLTYSNILLLNLSLIIWGLTFIYIFFFMIF